MIKHTHKSLLLIITLLCFNSFVWASDTDNSKPSFCKMKLDNVRYSAADRERALEILKQLTFEPSQLQSYIQEMSFVLPDRREIRYINMGTDSKNNKEIIYESQYDSQNVLTNIHGDKFNDLKKEIETLYKDLENYDEQKNASKPTSFIKVQIKEVFCLKKTPTVLDGTVCIVKMRTFNPKISDNIFTLLKLSNQDDNAPHTKQSSTHSNHTIVVAARVPLTEKAKKSTEGECFAELEKRFNQAKEELEKQKNN